MYVVIESLNANALSTRTKATEQELVAKFAAHGVDAIILPPDYRLAYGGVFVTAPEDPNRPAAEPSRPV